MPRPQGRGILEARARLTTHFPGSSRRRAAAAPFFETRTVCCLVLAARGSRCHGSCGRRTHLLPAQWCYATLCCGCMPLHTACPARFSRDPARFSLCQLDCFPRLVRGVVCLSLCLSLPLSLSLSLSVVCLVSCVLCRVSCVCVFVVCMRLSVSVTVSCVLCLVSGLVSVSASMSASVSGSFF